MLEIVNDDPGSRERDLIKKRVDYAAAGIAEYWIVDAAERRVTVLTLVDGAYQCPGEFAPGEQASSRLLEGFSLDVTATFQSAEG